MKDMKEQILKADLAAPFIKGTFGLEKEGLRVLSNGMLSLTPHPVVLGSRDFHPYIQTDFSESQLELITPPLESFKETYRFLEALHDVAARSLAEDELIWPNSMPGLLPDDEAIPIAHLNDSADVAYREGLAKKYGKRKQMISGIHYNFELSEDFVKGLYEARKETGCIEKFKTDIYMKLTHNFLRYRWLLTYLLGATPVADEHFWQKTEHFKKPERAVRSIRNSDLGYSNDASVQVSFESLEAYVADIEGYVAAGILSEDKEFYSPIRLRGAKHVKDMLTSGIRYIELRLFDLNPFAPNGMNVSDMTFVHLFMLYLLWLDEDQAEQAAADLGHQMNNQVALEFPLDGTEYQAEGERLLAGMAEMIESLHLPECYRETLDIANIRLADPGKTLAGSFYNQLSLSGQSYLEFTTALAKEYQAQRLLKPYQLKGYSNMELSTQLLMFDAIQRGVAVEIIDESEQFLKLTYAGQVEYVKNANMTSKDQYIAPLMMENKTVTKKVLEAAGFIVPAGEEYATFEEASLNYGLYKNKPIVVKPKSTNYGLGISIFKEGASREDYEQALKIAFKEDSAVLIETFIFGTEYRFFVLDGQVRAIMERVPANVQGDGVHTIAELVHEKNQDVLRGTDHRAPLELIQLGEIEQLMLKEQGFTIESIPEKGKIAYLRENSNVSTGGDSIDKTDEVDQSYKDLAVKMTAALGAKVSGVDLIVQDIHVPSTKENPGYAVIEANFNPAMHMHIYPYAGQGRRLTQAVLDMLFPTLK